MRLKHLPVLFIILTAGILVVTGMWRWTAEPEADYSPADSELIYTHSNPALAFKIPEVWREDHYEIKEMVIDGRPAIRVEYLGPESNHLLFQVEMFGPSEWRQVTDRTGREELARQENYVAVFKHPVGNPFRPPDRQRYRKMVGDLEVVIESFILGTETDLITETE